MNYSDSPNNIILRFNPKGLDNCIISCSDGSEMKLTTEANTYVTYMADCWPHPQKPVDSASRRTDPVCDDEISISGSGNSWITHPAKKWLKLGERCEPSFPHHVPRPTVINDRQLTAVP